MKEIAVHGSFHTSNFGDILLLCIYVHWLKKIDSDIRIVSASVGREALTFAQVKRVSRGYIYKNKIPIIFCGGGYLGEPKNRQFIWTLLAIKNHFSFMLGIHFFGNNHIFCGTGFGPISNFFLRYIAVNCLNTSKSVLLRDSKSIDFAVKYGVSKEILKMTADAVLSFRLDELTNLFRRRSDLSSLIPSEDLIENNITIGLHLQAPGNTVESLSEIVFNTLKEFKKKGRVFRVVLIGDSLKMNFSSQIDKFQLQCLNPIQFCYSSPIHLLDVIRKCDLIITTKLHVGIVASIDSKHLISIANHPKIERFYTQLNRIDLYVPLSNFNRKWLVEKLESFFSGNLNSVSVPENLRYLSGVNYLELQNFVTSSFY